MDPSKSLTKCVDIGPQQSKENNNSDNNKYKLSGQLLFRKTNFKAFAEGRGPKCVYGSDPVEYINGLPWKMELKWGGEHFGVSLLCEGDSNDMAWSCQAFCQFCIVSCTNDNKFFMHKGDFGNFNVHNAVNPSWGYANFAKFEEVMDPRNGLYDEEEDMVTFKAQVIAEKPRGMPGLRTDDFLLVNETMVYVNKYHLAANSDFFKTLFFGKNAQEMPRIVIDEDENAVANFERLISLVNSPTNAELDDECVETVLLLANRFLLDAVENHCVKFLMDESEKSAICKFRLAHQCGIIGMKDKILQKMKMEDFDFAGCYHYDVLSEHDKLDEEAAKELKKRHEELFERYKEILEDE